MSACAEGVLPASPRATPVRVNDSWMKLRARPPNPVIRLQNPIERTRTRFGDHRSASQASGSAASE